MLRRVGGVGDDKTLAVIMRSVGGSGDGWAGVDGVGKWGDWERVADDEEEREEEEED